MTIVAKCKEGSVYNSMVQCSEAGATLHKVLGVSFLESFRLLQTNQCIDCMDVVSCSVYM